MCAEQILDSWQARPQTTRQSASPTKHVRNTLGCLRCNSTICTSYGTKNTCSLGTKMGFVKKEFPYLSCASTKPRYRSKVTPYSQATKGSWVHVTCSACFGWATSHLSCRTECIHFELIAFSCLLIGDFSRREFAEKEKVLLMNDAIMSETVNWSESR